MFLFMQTMWLSCFFFFNDTATTEIYTLSLHDALPICPSFAPSSKSSVGFAASWAPFGASARISNRLFDKRTGPQEADRKSTRLNSSHQIISYAVFCLKKKRFGLDIAFRPMEVPVVCYC